jgi:hypothetical protein
MKGGHKNKEREERIRKQHTEKSDAGSQHESGNHNPLKKTEIEKEEKKSQKISECVDESSCRKQLEREEKIKGNIPKQ